MCYIKTFITRGLGLWLHSCPHLASSVRSFPLPIRLTNVFIICPWTHCWLEVWLVESIFISYCIVMLSSMPSQAILIWLSNGVFLSLSLILAQVSCTYLSQWFSPPCRRQSPIGYHIMHPCFFLQLYICFDLFAQGTILLTDCFRYVVCSVSHYSRKVARY